MKKKHMVWISVLLVLAAAIWYSFASDPLGGMKKTKVEKVHEQELERFMEKVVSAIERNDKRGLYKLFGSGDPMAFNRNYINRMFKEQDFCPVEIKEFRKLIRQDETYYQAEVISTRRSRRYIFTIEGHDGVFNVSSVEEL